MQNDGLSIFSSARWSLEGDAGFATEAQGGLPAAVPVLPGVAALQRGHMDGKLIRNKYAQRGRRSQLESENPGITVMDWTWLHTHGRKRRGRMKANLARLLAKWVWCTRKGFMTISIIKHVWGIKVGEWVSSSTQYCSWNVSSPQYVPLKVSQRFMWHNCTYIIWGRGSCGGRCNRNKISTIPLWLYEPQFSKTVCNFT